MADVHTEREVKLAAWTGFALPDLSDVVEGVTSSPLDPVLLDAVYHDTDDLRLARWGVTLRWRTGDGEGWTVKLPEGEDGPALVRREVTFPGAPAAVPEAAAALVRAFARRAPLGPVARLQTRRRGVELRDVEGHHVADVVDDEVTVMEGRRVAARFREVEVEVDDRAPAGLMAAVVRRLRAAGAGDPEPVPKVVRALGARALAPPELAPARLSRHPSAGEVVTAALVGSVARLVQHDPGVRIGDDPEDVHQARVATRRLRSDLRTFSPLLDEEWVTTLRTELAWFGGVLGAARDIDVLLDRFRRQATALPELDAAALAPLLRRLVDDREAARYGLMAAMDIPRYLELLDSLVAAAREPRLLPGATDPARDSLPLLVVRPWRKLARAVRDLGDDPADGQLHAVRILAKRARYACEAAIPGVGKEAVRLGRALARVQEVLGNHQDAVVAEQWLRSAVEGLDRSQAFAAGELVAVQRVEAAAHRAEWPAAWRAANRAQLRRWLA